MTPRQVGNVMADAYTGWQKETYAALLNRFSLPENKKFREFSRGMKMKLGLAVALSHQARLLILDEATGGLDPVVRAGHRLSCLRRPVRRQLGTLHPDFRKESPWMT